MSIVSHTYHTSRVVRSSFRDSIDASAEREAIAIEELDELTDRPTQYTRLQIVRMHAIEAAERGLPEPKRHAYRWTASCKAHRRLQDAPWSHIVFPPQRRLPSENNVDRRAETFLRRAALLLRLKQMPARQVIGLAEAALLTGVGTRTWQRCAIQGRLKARKVRESTGRNGTVVWRTTVGDVTDILSRKLAGEPVAA